MRQFSHGYPTAFANFGNGRPANLFSSYDDQTVQTHFRWMAENNLDTAALQRFDPNGGEGPTRNVMATKVMKAAEMYSRKFYIMYDISGWTTMQNEIKADWTNVIGAQLHITNSPMYAMQNGKPVVCIWGMGFNDSNHPFDAPTCLDVINWFKGQSCYVMQSGGVPTHWRDEKQRFPQAIFSSAYSAFNMISPWMVGRIGNASPAWIRSRPPTSSRIWRIAMRTALIISLASSPGTAGSGRMGISCGGSSRTCSRSACSRFTFRCLTSSTKATKSPAPRRMPR